MLKHEKYRKTVQIVKPVVPHPPDSSPGHPRGGATWCNKPTSTAATTCHDDMPRRPPSSFVWQKTSKTSTETTLRLNALPVVTSIHIARQSLRTPFHTIPYHSCLAKERTSCRLLPEPPKHEFCIFCRSFSSKHCFANWDTDSNTKDILGQVYL